MTYQDLRGKVAILARYIVEFTHLETPRRERVK